MHPLVIGFDTAGRLIHAEKILKRAEADNGLALICPLIL